MTTYDFICPKCGNTEIHNVSYEDRDSVMLTCSFCQDEEEILIRRTTCHGIKPEQSRHTPKEKAMMQEIREYHKIQREGWRKEARETTEEKIKRNNEIVKLKYTKR